MLRRLPQSCPTAALTQRAQRGFSLLEMVMVIVIIGILGTSISTLLSSGMGSYTAGRVVVDTLSSLRLANERIARELRTVRRDPTTPASFDFISSTASLVQFRRFENDGTTVTTVTIDSSGGAVRIAYNTPVGTFTLSKQIGTFALRYLQQDGINDATSNANVAFIDIDLSLTDSNGNSYPQRTRVALRNRQ